MNSQQEKKGTRQLSEDDNEMLEALELSDDDAITPPPPDLPAGLPEDERYFALISKALAVCASYKPKFGQKERGGLSLTEFHTLYGADPFYRWLGVDSPLMYAAHKAAGGMTSVYRQIGIGCQWIFYRMLQDHLNLSAEEAAWSYLIPSGDPNKKPRRLALDGRIDLENIKDIDVKERLEGWVDEAAEKVLVPTATRDKMRGVVFEVRQGYKSKDAGRQNKDILNATSAYQELYLPVILLFSNQIDGDVAERYVQAKWLLLSGSVQGSTVSSTYAFCRDVVGYDLAAFFDRNSPRIKGEVEKILNALLSA